jgi:cytochrome c556
MRSLAVFAFPVALALGALALTSTHRARAEEKEKAPALVPVDVNMHDFMEGMFQAPYRRLKVALATEPKDAAGWKAVRSDALILAEGSNLLLTRKPKADAELWSKHSVASRDSGAELLKAAKAKDYTAARKAYVAMLDHCNACHKKFEDGKHILAP